MYYLFFFFVGMPNPNFGYQFGAAGMPGMGGMSPQLNQENLLRIVQEMKSKVRKNKQSLVESFVDRIIDFMCNLQDLFVL